MNTDFNQIEIPRLEKNGKKSTLYVDGRPFKILGGELHNSSGSSLEYMETNVWPALRRIGGNCYLTPVYWECIEPSQGKYDFTLVDGVIEQAKREGVHLVLLWFGLWKNGTSGYVPAWIKRDSSYFYAIGQNGRMLESVSPFCSKAVEADKTAFEALMLHIRETDLSRTVIMIQVENEIGIWGHPRDYCGAANAAFAGEVPAEVAELFGVSGNWEEAFGLQACEKFMAWAYSRAIGTISSAGKAAYPLPMFMNCVPNGIGLSELAGSFPSGGPIVRSLPIYRKIAPAIDLYGPDIYAPFYKETARSFAAENTFILPETGQGKDCVSKALYTFAAFDTVCFSPFGIEGLGKELSENDLLAQKNVAQEPSMLKAGEQLSKAYKLLAFLNDEIDIAREEGRIYAFLEEGIGDEFILDDYRIHVLYKGMEEQDGVLPIPGSGRQSGSMRPDAPVGGGFILRRSQDRFLICGVSANISFLPAYAGTDSVFILEKREYNITSGGLVPGRNLNGDERNHLVLGSELTIQELTFYRRKG